MSFKLHGTLYAAMLSTALLSSPQVLAQSDDMDPEMRIERLENQLRQLTGQNEELQYRNRQLEEQLRALQGNAAPGQQAQPPSGMAAAPMQQPNGAYRQPAPQADYRQAAPQPDYRQSPPQADYRQQPQAAPVYGQQGSAPAPVVQPPADVASRGGRRGDAFDPSQNPNAPGAPQALGGGRMPVPADGQVGAPGGRGAGEPLDLANGTPGGGAQTPRSGGAGGTLTTLPPSATPKDEFDLGIGYMQRRDYALAEETMRNFSQKYPSDALVPDAQYWLGESFFQRQLYRDAAESFLAVTTKFDHSAKAPDALLRLGQSLAALKEKEAACAALGEVTRKYPRASSGVKQAVDREQKRVKC